MGFSQRLKELRESRGLSQEALADLLGIPRSSLAHYESAENEEKARLPRRERLEKIADFFGVSVDYLLGRTEEPSPPEEISKAPGNLPSLTPKEEKDIARDLERMLENLESDNPLAFYGEIIDDETKELLRISLENSMKLAKQLAKKKFTPKKYRE